MNFQVLEVFWLSFVKVILKFSFSELGEVCAKLYQIKVFD